MVAALWILMSLMAVPPLTEPQQAQLDQVEDDTAELIGPGMDALVENALQWEAGDEAGARVPDYAAMLDQPGEVRGDLFLLEGRFAGRARRIDLPQRGDWDETLTEWVLLVSDDPEQVVVIYFPDPADLMPAPATGANVRVVGRFYKVWADTDINGEPTRYPAFVARYPQGVGGETAATTHPLTPMLLLIVVLGGVYILLRFQTRRRRPDMPRHAMLFDSDTVEGTENPAEALRKMTEQHDDNETPGETHGDR